MPQRRFDSIQAILLDIEGTTTPVDYVFGVLFPFAKEQVAAFLETHGDDPAVQADLQRLRQEYAAENADVPLWSETAQETAGPETAGPETAAIAAVPYIHHLIAIDRKSTGLKSLQGKIWHQGYQAGTLRSQIFGDVQPAFQRWTGAGKRLFIFSSGSVQAQQLLFRHSEAGDLTGFLSGYFDTETGSKRESASYITIAQSIGLPPAKILFISDVTAELKAARSAGMAVLFSDRPGNHSTDSEGFPLIKTFAAVDGLDSVSSN